MEMYFKQDENKVFNNISNRFLSDMLKAWSALNFHTPISYKEIINQYLWFNSHIRVAKKVIYNETWA